MTFEGKILLGRITRVHGYEGTVIIRLEKEAGDYLQKMESVFIETEGILVPFFISESEEIGEGYLWLKFEGYESSDRVAEFTSCRIFMTKGVSIEEQRPGTDSLIGFEVSDRKKKTAGIIKRIIHNPGQDLIVLESEGGKEILIPLHSDLISGYNEEEKTLEMDIPEGLETLNE
jgi:16S rRNA processing protein RimM